MNKRSINYETLSDVFFLFANSTDFSTSTITNKQTRFNFHLGEKKEYNHREKFRSVN